MTHEQFFILTVEDIKLQTLQEINNNESLKGIFEEIFLSNIVNKVKELKIIDSIQRIPND